MKFGDDSLKLVSQSLGLEESERATLRFLQLDCDKTRYSYKFIFHHFLSTLVFSKLECPFVDIFIEFFHPFCFNFKDYL